jgi:chorismate lyase/3-hydroxybenzoate synthase
VNHFVQTDSPPLSICLGPDGRGERFDVGVPVLAGDPVENLFASAHPAGRKGLLGLHRTTDWLLGAGSLPVGADLEAATRRLYDDIFRAASGMYLTRIWNYVPAINATEPGALENYRRFCHARSLAFEERHGPGFEALLPAASAVGTKTGNLTVVFAASTIRPRHVENPLQVSAYAYPGEYGPRAPSFARATVVRGGAHPAVFISGTAAIRGHATIGPQDLLQQVECTLENLRELSSACGLGPELDRGGRSARHFKIYVRHAADQPQIASVLQEKLLTDTDRVSYLHADICRASLLVEIEATLLGARIDPSP